MLKGIDFCYWQEIDLTNMEKKLLSTALKTAFKKVIHKAVRATGEF